ncbi:MAG: 30S ribosomal protein S19e [Candidatus Woesearchaeota archaeon]|jgi:small subunit ribosomal protein S19e|nr:30S ribosomal protein S19e [Candidatus Woesearchaeota archaeon]MDP7610314.1 30S ribosomal protein S19e [Candidatus Woesearchaeota archaeon]
MKQSYTMPINELIDKTAQDLKKIKEIKPPVWANLVKTGVSRERVPVEKDWWYSRTASILRKVHILGPIGTSKLRTKYGSKKNRGVKPGKFYKSSGNIIRKVLQQLETAGLIIKKDKGVHKGRIITAKGKSLLFGK